MCFLQVAISFEGFREKKSVVWIGLLQSFIALELLDKKSSNFQCMLGIGCGFFMQNVNIELFVVGSQHNIEQITILKVGSIF